jgi:Fuc2NAc and GlcNAc transferase
MTRVLAALGCALAAILVTGLIRRHAPRCGLLDVPNVRSSHHSAVPRGGGLAVALIVLATALILALLRGLPGAEALAWLGGGSLMAGVGLLDDRGGLSVRGRLLAQLLAALCALWVCDAFPLDHGMHGSTMLRIATWLAGAIAIVWAINLFNFMDGIDGLAGQQALFVATAALFLGAGPPAGAEGWMLYSVAGATAGFLVWNWAPARIFMGDAGSSFLGFALALAAVATSCNGSLSLWTWLILQTAFIADATVTVCVRALRRERIYTAHRQHAYQRLARHWRSHARVSLAFTCVNVVWLLPLAAASVARPDLAARLALIALVPLCIVAVVFGAGRQGEIRFHLAHGENQSP